MIINIADGAVDSGFKGSQQPIIQNLGPGNIYIGSDPTDLLNNGLYLPAGAVYEFPATLVDGSGKVYIYTDTDLTDVRVINVG